MESMTPTEMGGGTPAPVDPVPAAPSSNPAIAGRVVFIDCETTGLKPEEGHRIIELAGVELVDGSRTGRVFHRYIDPEREIDPEAEAVHGISRDSLIGQPKFADIAGEFLEFARQARIVAHNAPFDIGFINTELERAALPPVETVSDAVIDTLAQARELHPGRSNKLDALCKRYGVDASARVLHGALLDAELLADVYLRMHASEEEILQSAFEPVRVAEGPPRTDLVVVRPNEAEQAAHQRHVAAIEAECGHPSLWSTLFGPR